MSYHLVIFNIAMERSTMLLRTVNHLFRLGPSKNHGEMFNSHNQRVNSHYIPWKITIKSPLNHHVVMPGMNIIHSEFPIVDSPMNFG